MDKLKPCPCCGSERVDTLKGNWMESDKPFSKVWCKSCQLRTWCEPTRKGAIAVWNARAADTELAAAKARIAELEADNEHLLAVNAGLQKKLEGLIPALKDCVSDLKLACRERTPAARRAAALLKEKE